MPGRILSQLAVGLLLINQSAIAAVIDFDVMQNTGSAITQNPYSEDGFTLINYRLGTTDLYPDDAGLFWGDLSGSFNADPAGATYSTNYQNSYTQLTQSDGEVFSFSSIDLGDIFNYGYGGAVSLGFTFADDSYVEEYLEIDEVVGLQTFTFNYDNVRTLDIASFIQDGSMMQLQLDNIVADYKSTTPVPEPTTLALIGAGLFGLGVSRRFARSKA